jgi:hypothetical protein
LVASLAGADSMHLLETRYQNLAVPNLSGFRGIDDGFDCPFCKIVA